MKILIVDDDKISRIIASNILVDKEYEVLEAESAKEAIEYLESGEPIRLVLCDIIMPEMDGLELLSYVNEELEFMNIPVIIYSSKRNETTVKKSLERGAKDYIAKPINSEKFIEKIKKALEDDIPPFANKEKIVEELQIGREKYDELVNKLIDITSSKIEEIRKFIEQEDFETLISILSSLQSASISLGTGRLLNALTKLGDAAQSKEADKCRKIVLSVKRELNILQEANNPTIAKTEEKKKEKKYSREYLRRRKKQIKEGEFSREIPELKAGGETQSETDEEETQSKNDEENQPDKEKGFLSKLFQRSKTD